MNKNKIFYKEPAIVLLFSVVMVTVGATVSSRAYAEVKALAPAAQVQVRNNEENKLAKKEGQSYKKQMQVLEKHYRKLAIKAKQNGENSAPLFAAADHFKAASIGIAK